MNLIIKVEKCGEKYVSLKAQLNLYIRGTYALYRKYRSKGGC